MSYGKPKMVPDEIVLALHIQPSVLSAMNEDERLLTAKLLRQHGRDSVAIARHAKRNSSKQLDNPSKRALQNQEVYWTVAMAFEELREDMFAKEL